MPTYHIPDEMARRIWALNKKARDFVKEAVEEKLDREEAKKDR